MKITAILAVVMILAIGGGAFVFFVWGPQKQEAERTHASEADRIKATITFALDDYAGYDSLESDEFKRRLRSMGYAPQFVNDGGNYVERHEKFASGEYDIMVLPISTYITHGGVPKGSDNYIGRIVAVVAESDGADNILAYENKLIGQTNRSAIVNDLNNPNLRLCFTEDSPSSFLLDWAVAEFDLWQLKTRGSWAVLTNGSKDAYERFERGECDVAILWEPYVSLGLEIPGVISVFGSDEAKGMTVDVFVAQRHMFDDHEKLDAVFLAYFEARQYHANNREEMIKEVLKNQELNKSREAAENILDRIDFADFHDNCGIWYDIQTNNSRQTFARQERIADSVAKITEVMVELGQFPSDPLKGNPYTIINDDVLDRLCKNASSLLATGGTDFGQKKFEALSDEEWASLREKGTIGNEPITFVLGTNRLTRDGKIVLEEVAKSFRLNYPNDRFLIEGHTVPSRSGSEEDKFANIEQSQQRAEAVLHYLKTIEGIDENRMHAVGVGGAEPLERRAFINSQGELQEELLATWRGRLPRVEFVLLRDK